MGTDPAPGGRGATARAMGSFQLEDFAAGWIGGEPTLDGRDPQRWGYFQEIRRVRETEREASRAPRGPSLLRARSRALCPRVPHAPRAPPAARRARGPTPEVLRCPPAARGNSRSLTEVHLGSRFASTLGSAELGPVMIKLLVQADSQWSVRALTHPSVTGCAPGFGDMALGTCG